MRYKQKFYYWCREAVCKIAYIPDMNKVYNELFEHLLDRMRISWRKEWMRTQRQIKL